MTKSKFALAATALVATLAAGTTTALAAQTPTAAPTSEIATFKVGTSGYLTVRLTKPADLAALAKMRQDLKAGKELDPRMHPIGTVVWDSTDVNEGHSWHLDPVNLTEMSTEVCDGQLHDVVKGKWQPKYYCPWNAELVVK